MNELRLQYQKETGIKINERLNYDFGGMTTEVKDYIKWLEEQLNRPLFPKARIDLVLLNSSEDYEEYIEQCRNP